MNDAGIAICLYSFLCLLIVIYECVRKRAVPYDALFFLNASFFVYFALAPIHVLVGGGPFARNTLTVEQFGLGSTNDVIWVFGSYLSAVFGFNIVPKLKYCIPIHRSSNQFWWIVIICLLIIAATSSAIYSVTVGGFLMAIQQATYIRMGAFEVSGQWLFLKHLIPLFSSAFLVGVAITLRNSKKRRQLRVDYFVVILLAVLAIYGAVVVGGRRVMIFPILILFLTYSNYKLKWSVVPLLLVLICTGLILVFWNAISFGIRDANFIYYLEGRYVNFVQYYTALWQPLTDPYLNWISLHNQDPPMLLFQDILFSPLHIVPESFFNIRIPDSIVRTSTELLKNAPLGEVTGTPPGFLGYLYINGGHAGILLGSCVFGMVGKVLHGIFAPRVADPMHGTIYLMIIVGWAYFLRHGVLEFIISERFHWWISMFVALFLFLLLMLSRHVSVDCNPTQSTTGKT